MTVWNRARLRQQQGPRRLTAAMALYPAELSLVRALETCRACGYQVHPPSCPTQQAAASKEASRINTKPPERPKGKPCPTCGYQYPGNFATKDCANAALDPLYAFDHIVHRDAWKASGALPGWHAHSWPSGAVGFRRNDKRAAAWIHRGYLGYTSGPQQSHRPGNYEPRWERQAFGTAQEAMAYADEQLRKEDEAKR